MMNATGAPRIRPTRIGQVADAALVVIALLAVAWIVVGAPVAPLFLGVVAVALFAGAVYVASNLITSGRTR